MASSCGGLTSFSSITVAGIAQVVGADEHRSSLTVKAAATNVGVLVLLTSQSQPVSEGWPLAAGEGYVFGGAPDGRGARPALYVSGTGRLLIATEGA
jgi:hypothetical protein